MKYGHIAIQIIELKNRDLKLRNKLIKSEQLGDGYNKDMADLHNQNADILREIINSIGYPTIDKVGEEAAAAAWLIIQHSIGQPLFMKKCAALLQESVNKQNAEPIHLAYLTDRIAVYEDRPQLYGTQFDWDEMGKMNPQKYDKLSKVNERRKAIGLNTLEEQIKIMRQQVKDENQLPPSDLLQRKKEMDTWRKSVGWLR